VAGQCGDARREAAAAVGLSRDSSTLRMAGRTLAWCGAAADAAALSAELTERFPRAILTTGMTVPVIEAASAMKSGQPMRALERLDAVKRFDHAPGADFWPMYLRGEAHRQLGHHAEAAAEFRSIVDCRGELADSPLYPLAYLGLARALASSSDPAGARQAYDEFFSLWKDADADLLPLQQARQEFGRLPR
jgi:tetratricopeptide (TPR) repeat protein